MRNFIFQNETSVYFGRGCVREYLGSLCAPYQRVMLVCARGELSRSGIGEEVSAILRGEGKLAAVFSGVSSALTYRQVLAGADAARVSEADMILALGIDAVIDCGKGISLAARCAHDVWEDYWAHPGVISVDPLPLGVIAAGVEIVSACSGRAVITNEEKHVRCARDYPGLTPRFALMDPSYPCSVPQVLSSSFGVFAHIMEIYFSAPQEDNVSDDLMEALMKGIVRDLRSLLRDPQDEAARSNLMWAAAVSETGIIRLGKQCMDRMQHIAHQLEAFTGCRHEEALAVLCLPCIRRLIHRQPAKFARFASVVWDVEQTADVEQQAYMGMEALQAFIRSLSLPVTLSQLSADALTRSKIAAACAAVPEERMTQAEVLEILQECR